MSDSEWLAKLKVGDKVLVQSGSGWGCVYTEGKVDRVTKTQVTVGLTKYNREKGWQVGYRYGGRIKPLDDDAIETLENQNRERETNTIANRLRSYRWHELPLETLRAIAALLPTEPKETP